MHEFHSHWVSSSGNEGTLGDADARFPYWSFTKTAIAICAVRLSLEGALDLDAPLQGQRYTLRQLLQHTAGVPNYGRLAEYKRAVAAGEPPWPREELLQVSLASGLLFEPGTGWSYSNVGYMLAKEWLESAAGQGLGAVVEEYVCMPLGLKSVELAQTKEQFAKLRWQAGQQYDPGWVYPGCLTGTAADAARMLHGLLMGDLLPPPGLAMVLERYPLEANLPGRPWTECGYGLGVMLGKMAGAGSALGHSGCGPCSVNAVYHFLDVQDPVTVACFSDSDSEGAAEYQAVQVATRSTAPAQNGSL